MVYKPNIPLPNDNISVSQGDIRENFTVANTSFGKNHYPFDNLTVNNGKHNYIEKPVKAVIPAGLVAGETTQYSKTDGAGTSQDWFTPDNTANEYQMTRAINAEFATFGNFTNYSGTLFGGWTFLPGGLIMQYGRKATGGAVTYPFQFPSGVFSVTTNGGSATSISTTGFTVPVSLGSTTYWMAIGN